MGGNVFKNFRQLLEGGNVFAGKTADIKKEFITPTLDLYFSELSKIFPKKKKLFNTKYMMPVGSVGKKPYSGDIDLLIDAKYLLDDTLSDDAIKDWGIDPQKVNELQEKFAKRARTATPTQLRIKSFLFILVETVNSKTKNIYSDPKKVGSGGIFSLYPQYDEKNKKQPFGVQIDWMISANIEWAKFSYNSSDTYTGHNDTVKGGNRTQLILSLFNYLDLTFNHQYGVKTKKNVVVASSPTESIEVLNGRFEFKKPITKEILDSYWKTMDFLLKNLSTKEYEAVISNYIKIIDKQRLPIPENLIKFYLKNFKKLGLVGKWVPDWQRESLGLK